MPGRPDLTEGEGLGLGTGVEECDLEGVPGDGSRLADELVKPLFDGGALAPAVKVSPVGLPRRLPVQEHPESHRGSWSCWPHDEVEIAGMEPVAIRPSASFAVAACSSMVQFPDRAQWLSLSSAGAV
jgi:hypothetical protein